MLVKVFGSAVFGVSATTITVEVNINMTNTIFVPWKTVESILENQEQVKTLNLNRY